MPAFEYAPKTHHARLQLRWTKEAMLDVLVMKACFHVGVLPNNLIIGCDQAASGHQYMLVKSLLITAACVCDDSMISFGLRLK